MNSKLGSHTGLGAEQQQAVPHTTDEQQGAPAEQGDQSGPPHERREQDRRERPPRSNRRERGQRDRLPRPLAAAAAADSGERRCLHSICHLMEGCHVVVKVQCLL